MHMIRRCFIWNVLLILCGAVMWNCAHIVRSSWADHVRETKQIESSVSFVFVSIPPVPEVVACLLLGLLAAILNRHAFAEWPTTRRILIGLLSVGIVVASVIVGSILESALQLRTNEVRRPNHAIERTADPRHASCVRTCRATGRGPLIANVRRQT
jgi:hypothetical protein